MSNDMNKQNLIEAFDMAKSIELSAAELYEQIAAAPDIQEQNIKTTFKNLAQDEHHHAGGPKGDGYPQRQIPTLGVDLLFILAFLAFFLPAPLSPLDEGPRCEAEP